MLKPVKALCPLILLALAACASDSPSTTADSAFEEEGPYAVIREDSDDFVYFFPENLDSEADWPALVWFNGASGYTEGYNYNGLLESVGFKRPQAPISIESRFRSKVLGSPR